MSCLSRCKRGAEQSDERHGGSAHRRPPAPEVVGEHADHRGAEEDHPHRQGPHPGWGGGGAGAGGGGRIERREEEEGRNDRRSGRRAETISELINTKYKLGFFFSSGKCLLTWTRSVTH